MITVKLKGGLGNQMFQYALGRALQERRQEELRLDLTSLLDRRPRRGGVVRDYGLRIFECKPRLTLLSRLALRCPIPWMILGASWLSSHAKDLLHLQSYVRERRRAFDSGLLAFEGDVYLDGYWQCERYFRDAEQIIRREFTFRLNASPEALATARQIGAVESVCIHVRRGDYVSVASSRESLGFVGHEYYRKALDVMRERVSNPHLFVASDDIEWCKANLRCEHPTTYLTHRDESHAVGEDLWLMSLCKHFVISNSTFAWWAAWLSTNPSKCIVAPKRWFRDTASCATDLVPESWQRV